MIGQVLGHYRIHAALGAGGMGEVYQATDTRLGREVAIKVLPAHLGDSESALARFEREARAVAALSHPNILAIHDFGTHEGRVYAAMELLEGESLRAMLGRGALPVRKAAEYAAQVARGVAAAHDKEIVHRDLKPENVFVTKDGQVKVLDFGLARSRLLPSGDDTNSPTMAPPTDPGAVLGTAGYMSPEQVRGRLADHRSDIFSLGCVLYEMLTGRRAFVRETSAETMTAILKDEPPDLAESGVVAPPTLQRLLHHCLEKRPEDRFQSARDLAFDLEAAVDPSSRSGTALDAPPARRRFAMAWVGGAVLLALGVAAGYALGRRTEASVEPARAEPSFRRLTFGQGTVWSARFAPEGRNIVFSAAWDGAPIRLFTTRGDEADSAVPATSSDAHLLAISSSGELAVSLGHRFDGWMGEGTLARIPHSGEGARPIQEGVREADWTPDGSALAIVRADGRHEQVEFPAGKVLFRTTGYVSHLRFSPAGDRLAFVDHPIWADNMGRVSVMDREGRKTDLTQNYPELTGATWSPAGDEVWFTASKGREEAVLRGVDLQGRERLVHAGLADMVVFDTARDGRILLGRTTRLRHVEARTPESATLRRLALRHQSMARFISADGKAVSVTDQSVGGYSVYLRPTDGSPPVRLGEGDGFGISPDGRWVLALTFETPRRLLVHPTGPGQTREVPNPERVDPDHPFWLPDGRIGFFGVAPGRGSRGYVTDLSGSPPKAFTPEGVNTKFGWNIAVSPDSTRVVGQDLATRRSSAYRFDGGAPEPLPLLTPRDLPLTWSSDGRALFVADANAASWHVQRLDLATGQRTPLTEVQASEVAGMRLSQLFIAPDGRSWVHSYSRLLTDLYLAEGLR